MPPGRRRYRPTLSPYFVILGKSLGAPAPSGRVRGLLLLPASLLPTGHFLLPTSFYPCPEFDLVAHIGSAARYVSPARTATPAVCATKTLSTRRLQRRLPREGMILGDRKSTRLKSS